ncbi:ECF transporter S component [Mycoplasmopsis lipofaciens]|uniref:ECF transporter S component n=1 Tax=Mycoplasmopsis lipofaciens TaxID=114884 RepID=UPI00055E483E|nr:ECF transporter S component [Mycoplasmopsis lipofaciens]
MKILDTDKETKNENETEPFNQKIKKYFKNSIKVKIFDISLGGILLGMQIILMIIAKLTILKIVPLEIEFVFYIFYGLIFGPFKGSFFAILGDTLVLLITGYIGTWFWLYAIIPPLIAITSSIYFFIFKNVKSFRLIFSIAILLSSLIIILVTYFMHVNEDGTFNISKSKTLPKSFLLWMIIAFASLIILAFITLYISYKVTKKEKIMNYLLVFSLIIFIVIIYRWTLGPIAYISWYNHFNKTKGTTKFKTLGTDYVLITIPIIIKSVITIPVYTLILTPIFNITHFLKEKYIDSNNSISY